jgi:hypothetical protein
MGNKNSKLRKAKLGQLAEAVREDAAVKIEQILSTYQEPNLKVSPSTQLTGIIMSHGACPSV